MHPEDAPPTDAALLDILLEEIGFNVRPNDPIALYADEIRKRRSSTPRLHITVAGWMDRQLLERTPYRIADHEPMHGLQGRAADALAVAADLVDRGFSVQILRVPLEHGPDPERIEVWADDKRFQPR